jgi:hypothetical protein
VTLAKIPEKDHKQTETSLFVLACAKEASTSTTAVLAFFYHLHFGIVT